MSSAPPPAKGDMGRRIAARRLQLGLSRQDVALRAGAAPGYIEYVEEQPATPGIGFLLRLADALETTVEELSGSTGALPPGFGRGARRARMVELDEAMCWTLLGDHGVGRVALTLEDGPVVLPVNYQVLDGEVMFSTGSASPLAAAADTEIAFEADHIDDAFSDPGPDRGGCGAGVLAEGVDDRRGHSGGEDRALLPVGAQLRERADLLLLGRPGLPRRDPLQPARARLACSLTSARGWSLG
ncbi:helix-turn-helix domain-containing protein [Streptomyces anulatus]